MALTFEAVRTHYLNSISEKGIEETHRKFTINGESYTVKEARAEGDKKVYAVSEYQTQEGERMDVSRPITPVRNFTIWQVKRCLNNFETQRRAQAREKVFQRKVVFGSGSRLTVTKCATAASMADISDDFCDIHLEEKPQSDNAPSLDAIEFDTVKQSWITLPSKQEIKAINENRFRTRLNELFEESEEVKEGDSPSILTKMTVITQLLNNDQLAEPAHQWLSENTGLLHMTFMYSGLSLELYKALDVACKKHNLPMITEDTDSLDSVELG